MTWLPIETLSKLYNYPVLFCEKYPDGYCFYFIGKVDKDTGAYYNTLDYATQLATHWMPLPPPPEDV